MRPSQLTLIPLLERAGTLFPNVEIVSQRPDNSTHRYTYSDVLPSGAGARGGPAAVGLRPGDRVASLMWNHSMHLEAYFGVPVVGGVLHTLNLRLHPDELAYIVNNAGDRFLIVDDVLLPVFEKIKEQREPRARHRGAVQRGARPVGIRRLRGRCCSRAAAVPRMRTSTNGCRRHVLHVGHDRQAQGRRLFPSRDGVARAVDFAAGQLRDHPARHDPAGDVDVSRQRLGPAARRRHERQPRSCSPGRISSRNGSSTRCRRIRSR